MRPEKLIVIGCSAGGKDACEYLFPLIELNSSSIVLVPHIQNSEIYESLRFSLRYDIGGDRKSFSS